MGGAAPQEKTSSDKSSDKISSGGLAAVLGMQAAGGIFSAFSQDQEAKSSQAYYSYLAATAKTNKGLAEAAGKANLDELSVQQADQMRRIGEAGRATVGAQKAALAAGGAGVGSKTGEQIMSDTANRVNMDEMALRYNSDLKAKSIRTGVMATKMNLDAEAAGYNIAGGNARRAGRLNQFGTILGTAGSVASTWYKGKY